jgi:hypothetical protein
MRFKKLLQTQALACFVDGQQLAEVSGYTKPR